jgi:hypothetical protein
MAGQAENSERFIVLVCLRLITCGGPAIKRQKDEIDQPLVQHQTEGSSLVLDGKLIRIPLSGILIK